MRRQALNLLRTAVGDPEATFRDGQWECIEPLLANNKLLVVQRTGWGKSMVYFIATKLLRNQGRGVTIIVSPLLALMRNQIDSAERMGVTAVAINSANNDEWNNITEKIRNDEIDVLFISPERFANANFIENTLPLITDNAGLFVVDEAHCISDWGHDFRPDYKRIVRILQYFPPNTPVLATTATANNRVVSDIQAQLGDIQIIRGTLSRESLFLQNMVIPSPAERMGWLAEHLPSIEGSGIIYTLTKRDAEQVANWLQSKDIIVRAYHSDLPSEEKISLENALLANEVKALVSTVAIGMGFDKPDLSFVIHYQRPASVVHYYQQVGRAGRALTEAYGLLFSGEEDSRIADYFIRSAFPLQGNIDCVLRALRNSEIGLSKLQLGAHVNLSHSAIEKVLKFLSIESPSPILKEGSLYQATAAAANYEINQEIVTQLTNIRTEEQVEMNEYVECETCLMQYLSNALDCDLDNCGHCANCDSSHFSREVSRELISEAGIFLKRNYKPLKVRKQWPISNMMDNYGFVGRNIPNELRAAEGRALCQWRDAGWGTMVADGKANDSFSDELVQACATMFRSWNPDETIENVCCIPSTNHPNLVPDFARRLADALELNFVAGLNKIQENAQQKTMENSYNQAKNLDGVFRVSFPEGDYAACLLVDDIVDSGWTMTVGAALLRQAGIRNVYPIALALNSPRMD